MYSSHGGLFGQGWICINCPFNRSIKNLFYMIPVRHEWQIGARSKTNDLLKIFSSDFTPMRWLNLNEQHSISTVRSVVSALVALHQHLSDQLITFQLFQYHHISADASCSPCRWNESLATFRSSLGRDPVAAAIVASCACHCHSLRPASVTIRWWRLSYPSDVDIVNAARVERN